MISFHGNYIGKLNIMKRQDSDNYIPDTASFVRLHPEKMPDINAIKNAVMSWNSTKQIASYIVDDIVTTHFQNIQFGLSGCTFDYYVATTQKEDFENLIPQKIFGVVEVTSKERGKSTIDFLEIKPEYSFDNLKRTIKGTGHAIMSILKRMYAETDISVLPLGSAVDFYKKEGFIPDNTRKYYYIFKKH